jgi:hypothetical protein
LNTLATITDRKAGFRSLGDAWADTTTSHGRLMVTVLGGLAGFERDLIRARTGEGERQEPWAAVQDDGAPEEGSTCAARERGATDGDRPQLQRQRGDDFEVNGVTSNP